MPILGGYEYSENEVQLIKQLDLLIPANSPSLPPILLYQCMAIACFRDNRNDKVSDSVRRCLLELEKPKNGLCRLTPEWDALISL